MLEHVSIAIDSIPVAVVALFGVPALWAKIAWASPYLKTYRHATSGLLSLLAGMLLVASLRGDRPAFPMFLIGAAIATIAMFVAMFWPPPRRSPQRKVR